MTSRQTTGTDSRETGHFYTPIFLQYHFFFRQMNGCILTVPCCFKFSPDEKIVPCNRQTLAFWYDCATISTSNDSGYGVFIWEIKLVTYILKRQNLPIFSHWLFNFPLKLRSGQYFHHKNFSFLEIVKLWKRCAIQEDISKWIAIILVISGPPQ